MQTHNVCILFEATVSHVTDFTRLGILSLESFLSLFISGMSWFFRHWVEQHMLSTTSLQRRERLMSLKGIKQL